MLVWLTASLDGLDARRVLANPDYDGVLGQDRAVAGADEVGPARLMTLLGVPSLNSMPISPDSR